MSSRRSAAAWALVAAAIVGCSKTQDTAPEQRVFGTPPVIQSVSLITSNETASCDITDTAVGFLCAAGFTPDMYTFAPGPTVSVEVIYSQFEFLVRVTDPESTPAQSNVLLVTASYVTPPSPGGTPEETSLLLLDDGSENTFPFRQTGGAPEACTIDIPNGICSCTAAEYPLTTNDVTKGDDVFTRGFAFVAVGANVPANGIFMVHNCVARDRKQAPAEGSEFVGTTVSFKLEAIDRQGNLVEWPERPTSTIAPTSLSCVGDPCICCLLSSSEPDKDPPVGCRGLPGLIGTSISWGDGVGLCTVL